MFEFAIFVVTFACSMITTGYVRRYALMRGVVDTPNARSSHHAPTPRGGGFGVALVFLCAVLVLATIGELEVRTALAIALGSSSIAGIGFLDDHKPVPASWRLVVQILASTLAISMLGGLPDIPIGNRVVDLGWFGGVLAIFFAVWFTNAFNFMDGIDGIAASEAICISAGALFIMLLNGDDAGSILLIVIVSSTSGFLMWNWPPAKIFMGDVGSAFLGFVLFAVAIMTSGDSSISIWSWLILGGVFIVDASVTLSIRMLRKENWISPHRSHAYQIASRRFNSHKVVTIAVILINTFWLFPIAVTATVVPEIGWWLIVIAWTPLVWASLRLGAGRKEN